MMYLQGAYNIIDTIWVGQLLGKVILAGIATGGFMLWYIFGLTNLMSVGISAMLARRIGEDNQPGRGGMKKGRMNNRPFKSILNSGIVPLYCLMSSLTSCSGPEY